MEFDFNLPITLVDKNGIEYEFKDGRAITLIQPSLYFQGGAVYAAYKNNRLMYIEDFSELFLFEHQSAVPGGFGNPSSFVFIDAPDTDDEQSAWAIDDDGIFFDPKSQVH